MCGVCVRVCAPIFLSTFGVCFARAHAHLFVCVHMSSILEDAGAGAGAGWMQRDAC